MRVQTKLILSLFPVVLAGFLALGGLSYSTAKNMMRANAERYIDIVLDARCNQTLLRRAELLRRSKMDRVASFVSLYQQEAEAELKVGSDSRFGCFVVFNRKGDFLFASGDCTAAPLLAQFRRCALQAAADPAQVYRGQIDEGARRIFGARYFEPWDWVLVYSTEANGFAQATRRMFSLTLLLSSGCVAVCALVIVVVFRRVFGLPVVRLKTAAARIANRESNVVIAVDSKDELGELSASLNAMAAAIADYIGKLERLTGDLEKANEAQKLEIADRCKAQRELKDAHDKLTATVRAIPDLLFEVDGDGRIYDYHAPHAQDLLLDPPRFLNRCIREVMPREAAEAIMAAIGQAAQHDRHRGTIYSLDMPTGKRWYELSIAVKGEPSGPQTRFMTIAHDITERKQAEDDKAKLESQLRQSQKIEALGTLAGGIAHDFNNILAGITGYISLIRPMAGANAELLDYLEEINRAGQRATKLVQQILAFSRADNQTLVPLQLRHVVAEAVQLLRATIPSTIEIQALLATDLPAVLGNATQLHQVVMNLGTNSWYAMRARGGRLNIRLEALAVTAALAGELPDLNAGPYVRLTVSDTGCGMDAATQARVFEPFFTTKAPGEGTGLGLSVLHGIVHHHQGAIRLTSAVDHGTTFEIFLPTIGSPPNKDSDEPGQIPHGKGERILFVDDEPTLVRIGDLTLRQLGYTAECESQVLRALVRVEQDPRAFQLVITDQTMPEMTGLEFATRIHALRPDLPVILASGYSLALTPEGLQAAGVKEVLAKPFSVETMASAIHRHLPSGPAN